MRKNDTDWKALYTGMCENYIELHARTKTQADVYATLSNLPETFTFMGKTYTKEKEVDPWGGCACGSSSTCGTTFTTDSSGVTTKYPEGRYTVLIKREQ